MKSLNTYYLYATLFVSGAVILIIEISGARVLSPFFGSTIFVWSSLISVTLGFLALGYFVGGFIADKHPKAEWFYSALFLGGALALLLIKISQPLLVISSSFGFRGGALVASLLLFALPLFFLSMAGPFAIRLLARDLEHTGHTAGIVFGVSTVGSLLGALLAGFYLIPNFFVTTIFTIAPLIIMTVAVIGVVIEKISPKKAIGALLVLISLYFIPFVPGPERSGVILLHTEPSFYGDIQVVERGGFRCMGVKSQSQTCMRVADGKQAIFYGTLIDDLLSTYDEGKALIIGFGGGILARDLKDNFDHIDAVEIDPKMYAVAKDFFKYDDADPTLSSYVDDGRVFLKGKAGEYDVIILDAFSGSNPAPHLYTKEAFQEMKNALTDDGVLIVNSIGRSHGEGDILPRSLLKTANSVFPFLGVLSTENIKENSEAFGNILFIASVDEKEFAITDEHTVVYSAKDIEDALLFTDDYIPIETLGLSVYEESLGFYQNIFGTL